MGTHNVEERAKGEDTLYGPLFPLLYILEISSKGPWNLWEEKLLGQGLQIFRTMEAQDFG